MTKSSNKDLIKNSIDIFNLSIPFSIFQNDKLTVFESLVVYLKENLGYKFSEISSLLNRDERNIWTVYNRARRKNER